MATKHLPQPPVQETDSNGRHRIITFRGGIPAYSQWFEPYEIGFFRGLNSSVRQAGGIPHGLFRVSAVAHETL